MDAFRRGWVGLILFCSAIVLIPVLVANFQGGVSSAAELTAADRSDTLRPAADRVTDAARTPSSPPASAPTTSAAPRALVRFGGVSEGEIIHDFVRITLETTGRIDKISYLLTGPTGKQYVVDATEAPYAFAPHPSGWQTNEVIDGVYTLRATVGDPRVTPVTIRFEIRNTATTAPRGSA